MGDDFGGRQTSRGATPPDGAPIHVGDAADQIEPIKTRQTCVVLCFVHVVECVLIRCSFNLYGVLFSLGVDYFLRMCRYCEMNRNYIFSI